MKSSKKSAVSSETEALDLWLELFEDTISLAAEDGACRTTETFTAFMQEMLPPEIMKSLEDLCGSSTILEDIWLERFKAQSDSEEDENYSRAKFCVMCERENVRLTRHHLYPRETHQAMQKKGIERAILNQTIPVCGMCHGTIHRFFSNVELSAEYFTLDRLMSDERIFKYAAWASKQGKNKRSL
jgi:hypothetical protein